MDSFKSTEPSNNSIFFPVMEDKRLSKSIKVEDAIKLIVSLFENETLIWRHIADYGLKEFDFSCRKEVGNNVFFNIAFSSLDTNMFSLICKEEDANLDRDNIRELLNVSFEINERSLNSFVAVNNVQMDINFLLEDKENINYYSEDGGDFNQEISFVKLEKAIMHLVSILNH